jgi:hypothetical protein
MPGSFHKRPDPAPKPSADAPRRALHVYLTVRAHDRWHDTAADEGVSVSALVEVLSGELTDHPRWPEIVKAARAHDAANRRRGPNRR